MVALIIQFLELLLKLLYIIATVYVLFPSRFRKVPRWLKHLLRITVNRKG